MLLLKQGFPEEDELVLCTVTNIQYHSVFVNLDEYNKVALIHISEIAPGRIRNIRDFVEESKKVVCKVLNVDKKTGHIDLSLRRVNEIQKRKKIDEIKQEQKAEKIIEILAKDNKKEVKKLYDEITAKVFTKFSDLTSCFREAVRDEKLFENLGIEKGIAEQLHTVIKIRFKEEEVVIGGTLILQSYEPNGLEIVRKTIKEVLDTDTRISILYEGGGKYKIDAKSNNYKDAEKILEKATQKAISLMGKGENKVEFARKEKKE